LKYVIESGSEVYLVGSSNINNFTCYCKEDFSNEVFTYSIQKKETVAEFENTILSLESRSLDCGNNRMNRDMYQTLKVEKYPFINIELKEVILKAPRFLSQHESWIPYNAWVNVTVAGVTKPKLIEVSAISMGYGRYRFVSSAHLEFSDFNLEQPIALMGLVKVKNEISIYFDIILRTRGEIN